MKLFLSGHVLTPYYAIESEALERRPQLPPGVGLYPEETSYALSIDYLHECDTVIRKIEQSRLLCYWWS